MVGLKDDRLEKRLQDMSYESRYISENMGSVFVLLTLIFIGLCLMVLIAFLWGMLPIFVRRFYVKLKDFLLWNVIIRLYMEAAIELIICTVLNLRFGNLANGAPWAASLNTVLAYLYTGMWLVAPFLIYFFYTRNFTRLEDE